MMHQRQSVLFANDVAAYIPALLRRDALIRVCTNTRSLCVCEAGDSQKGGATNRSEIDRPHGSFPFIFTVGRTTSVSRQPIDPSDLNQ
jgi:hypothetical protein